MIVRQHVSNREKVFPNQEGEPLIHCYLVEVSHPMYAVRESLHTPELQGASAGTAACYTLALESGWAQMAFWGSLHFPLYMHNVFLP